MYFPQRHSIMQCSVAIDSRNLWNWHVSRLFCYFVARTALGEFALSLSPLSLQTSSRTKHHLRSECLANLGGSIPKIKPYPEASTTHHESHMLQCTTDTPCSRSARQSVFHLKCAKNLRLIQAHYPNWNRFWHFCLQITLLLRRFSSILLVFTETMLFFGFMSFQSKFHPM